MADFFNKMMDGINKGIATASVGSKTVFEKNKHNTIIKNLENEKKQLAELIGNKVFDYCAKNEGDVPRDLIANFCAEIDSRNAQIQEQIQQIAILDAEMDKIKGSGAPTVSANTCSCGHPNNVGAKFCGKCGKQLF